MSDTTQSSMILSHIVFQNRSKHTSGFNTFRKVCFGMKRSYDSDRWVQVMGYTDICTYLPKVESRSICCVPYTTRRRYIEIVCIGETHILPLRPTFVKNVTHIRYTVPLITNHVLRVSYSRELSTDFYRVKVCLEELHGSGAQSPPLHRKVSSTDDMRIHRVSSPELQSVTLTTTIERQRSANSIYFPITQQHTEQYMTGFERRRTYTGC